MSSCRTSQPQAAPAPTVSDLSDRASEYMACTCSSGSPPRWVATTSSMFELSFAPAPSELLQWLYRRHIRPASRPSPSHGLSKTRCTGPRQKPVPARPADPISPSDPPSVLLSRAPPWTRTLPHAPRSKACSMLESTTSWPSASASGSALGQQVCWRLRASACETHMQRLEADERHPVAQVCVLGWKRALRG